MTDYATEHAICPQCGTIRPPAPLVGVNAPPQTCPWCCHRVRMLGLAELAVFGAEWTGRGYPEVGRQYQKWAEKLRTVIAEANHVHP